VTTTTKTNQPQQPITDAANGTRSGRVLSAQLG